MDFKTIPLSQGLVAIVDAADFEWLNQWKWHAWENPSGAFYAVRNRPKGRGQKTGVIYMHRLIMGVEDPTVQVDHINHETLDNRRSQLRLCTQRQNSFNTRKHSNNTSGFNGVTQRKDNGKWGAYIRINGRKKNLGAYATPELAAQAYAEAAVTHHGEFARL